MARGTEARFHLPQKTLYSYASLGSVTEYNMNNICIRQINSTFQAKKGSKNTRLKGMDEFLQAELEIGQTEAARHREKPVEDPHQRCSRGAVAKRTQSHST